MTPEPLPTNREQRLWTEAWLRRAPSRLSRLLLALTERFHPQAYLWLVRNDQRAAQIAHTAGWPKTNQPTEHSPNEIASAEATARNAVAFLRNAIPATAKPNPQPNYLTPAQLDIANPLPNNRKRAA